ncbi:MAG TPA: anti-sigma factor [Acetobacteraceae bacterium]|nr:anti-sigma factor [Acetobacteraceae bacterium]
MSDAPEDRAGLYVLGVLDDIEMAEVRRDAAQNPTLAASIADWERRLAPLGEMAGEVPPPASVWTALELAIGRLQRPVAAASAVGDRAAWQGAARRWRSLAFGSMALAASAAGLLLWRVAHEAAQPPARYAVVLPMQGKIGGWLIEVRPNGEVRAVAQGGVSHPDNKDFELWALAERATTPEPLGVLPVGSAAISLHPRPLPKAPFELLVSLEPKGGSPTGLPTGPVMFAGEIAEPHG